MVMRKTVLLGSLADLPVVDRVNITFSREAKYGILISIRIVYGGGYEPMGLY